MELEEIIQRLDESIGVPAFYIGKAFKVSKYKVDELKQKVNIWSCEGKNIDIKIDEAEDFFDNYSPIFASKKTPALLNSLLHKKEEVAEHFDIPKIPEYLIESRLDEPKEEESIDDHILTDEELEDFEFDENRKHSKEKKSNGTLSKTVQATKNIKPVETLKKEETAPALFTSPDEMKVTLNDVKNILMDNIKKVQENSDYIPQANTVNQSVNSLINLAKLSLQMMSQRDKLK